MELGQRIKQARLEAGLSQRQLCGEAVTRNMLSLIENGSARPSMDTLRYFAARLEKPIGWFLEEQAVSSPNWSCMDIARKSWLSGDPEAVLEALKQYRSPDETFDSEKGLLEFLACLSAGEAALQEGRKPYALHFLKLAGQAKSPYITAAQQQALQLLLARAGQPAQLNSDEVLLLRAEQALAADPNRCLEILQAADDQVSAQWLWLAGQARFALAQYRPAAQALTAVESLFPQSIPMLEVCWRELGDYQKAYEYACKGRK